MKIHFMKENALSYFKGNVESNLLHYRNETNNDWVIKKYKNYTEEETPFEVFKFEVPELKMDMNSDKPEELDYKNIRIIHTAFKQLTATQAADERLWVGLSHNELYSFVRYRIKIHNQNITEKKILGNFYFNQGKKRSLIVNPISRLWWVGHLIYDKDNTIDPYEGVEFFKKDSGTRILSMFSSNFTNNPKVTRALLKSFIEIEKNGYLIKREEFLEILRYINVLGGIVLLDYLSEDELKEKVITHFYKVNNI